MTTPIESAKTVLAPDVDALAQEIRRVDGKHDLGAGALAEALMPFLASRTLKDLEGSAQGGVRVRELEWGPYASDGSTHKAKTDLAHYVVWEIGGRGYLSTEEGRPGRGCDGDLDAAKAAAQADFDRRILSALSASPPLPVHQVDGEAVAWIPPGGLEELRKDGDIIVYDRKVWPDFTPLFTHPQQQETVETLKRDLAEANADLVRSQEETCDHSGRLMECQTDLTNAEARIAELEKRWGKTDKAAARLIGLLNVTEGYARDLSWQQYFKGALADLRAALAPDASKIEGAGL